MQFVLDTVKVSLKSFPPVIARNNPEIFFIQPGTSLINSESAIVEYLWMPTVKLQNTHTLPLNPHPTVVKQAVLWVTVAFCRLKPVRPFPSDLWHQQGIFAQRIAAHCNNSFLNPVNRVLFCFQNYTRQTPENLRGLFFTPAPARVDNDPVWHCSLQKTKGLEPAAATSSSERAQSMLNCLKEECSLQTWWVFK